MRLDQVQIYVQATRRNFRKLRACFFDPLFIHLSVASGDEANTPKKKVWCRSPFTSEGYYRPGWRMRFGSKSPEGCSITVFGPTGWNPFYQYQTEETPTIFDSQEHFEREEKLTDCKKIRSTSDSNHGKRPKHPLFDLPEPRPKAATALTLVINCYHKWSWDGYHGAVKLVLDTLDLMKLDYRFRRVEVAFDTLNRDTAYTLRKAIFLRHARIGFNKAGKSLIRSYILSKKEGDRGYREEPLPMSEWKTSWTGGRPDNPSRTNQLMHDERSVVGSANCGEPEIIRTEFTLYRRACNKHGLTSTGLISTPNSTWSKLVRRLPKIVEDKLTHEELNEKRLKEKCGNEINFHISELRDMTPYDQRRFIQENFKPANNRDRKLKSDEIRKLFDKVPCPVTIVNGLALSEKYIEEDYPYSSQLLNFVNPHKKPLYQEPEESLITKGFIQL